LAANQFTGDIFVSGKTGTDFLNDYVAQIASYTQSGHAASGFGTGGIVSFTACPFDIVRSFNQIALRPDGKILAFGEALVPAAGAEETQVVARFNPDGTVDPDLVPPFGTICFGGFTISASFDPDVVFLLQPDNKFILSGHFDFINRLFRFTADGSNDTTFLNSGNFAQVVSMALQPNQKIVTLGRNHYVNEVYVQNNPKVTLARFLP
jgi:uncharacterized delta-60 repeat protein